LLAAHIFSFSINHRIEWFLSAGKGHYKEVKTYTDYLLLAESG
jgi:hypothetical protein